MDLINKDKKFAQLVEVVNELKARIETSESDPLNVTLPDYSMGSGSSVGLKVYAQNSGSWVNVRPSGNNVTLHISSVQIVNSGVGYVFPVNLYLYNITQSAVASNVNAVYTSYVTRFSTASSVVIFYETFNSSGTVTATSYNATD